jgi:hypothetical protein
MKNLLLILAILLFAMISFAQDAKKDDWFRVQSDDGEFSIEVPANYGYFYDKDGTTVGDYSQNYLLNEMSVFNSYTEHTLISFESYKANQKALEVIETDDESLAKWQKDSVEWTESQKDGYKIKQLIVKNDKQYTVRQYFFSKTRIFALVASSRLGETKAMKQFFDSLIFKPNVVVDRIKGAIIFSVLKATPIEYRSIQKKENNDIKPKKISLNLQTDPTVKPFLLISQPKASYTDDARKNGEQGIVQIRLELSEFGQITKISQVKSLRF